MKLALINNKGGVAKTTTALNIAASFALGGARTLLVDLDSQGAASLSLGLRRAELIPGAADVLLDRTGIQQAIRGTGVPNLDLLTGSNELAGFDSAVAQREGRELQLRQKLSAVEREYTHIVLDCPPSLSLLSVNALVAADVYAIPVTPHYLTMGGLASIVEEVNKLCERNTAPVAELLGVVLTMVDARNRTTAGLVNSLRKHWGELVFDTEIKHSVKLAEAPAFGKTIYDHAPQSRSARAYQALADEIAARYAEFSQGSAADGGHLAG